MSATHPLVEELKAAGLCKHAAIIEEGAECSLIACKLEGDLTLLIAAVTTPEAKYAKAAPEECIPPDAWACNIIFYMPYGVYTYGNSWREVAERLTQKTTRLRVQASLCTPRQGGL